METRPWHHGRCANCTIASNCSANPTHTHTHHCGSCVNEAALDGRGTATHCKSPHTHVRTAHSTVGPARYGSCAPSGNSQSPTRQRTCPHTKKCYFRTQVTSPLYTSSTISSLLLHSSMLLPRECGAGEAMHAQRARATASRACGHAETDATRHHTRTTGAVFTTQMRGSSQWWFG